LYKSYVELSGAISLGKTMEESRRNLDEAIEMVLEGNQIILQSGEEV
jgi:predicted RNase H-like HicB family nuclease